MSFDDRKQRIMRPTRPAKAAPPVHYEAGRPLDDHQPPPRTARSAKPPAGSVRRILIGVVVGLSVIAGSNLLLMPMLGRAQKEAFENPQGERALRAVKADKSFDNFALTRSCELPSFGMTLPRRGGPRDPASDMPSVFLDAAAEGEHARKMAEFVTCTLRTMPHRYCARQQRKVTVDQVSEYLSMRRKALRAFAHASRASVSEVEALYRKAVRDNGGQLDIDAIAGRSGNAAWTRNMFAILEVDADMIAAIQARIQDGYFSASDFSGFLGLFMPSELEPHLAKITPDGSPCS